MIDQLLVPGEERGFTGKKFHCLLGAIAGDIIGSRHEFQKTKSADFELFTPACTFTDDTVLTVAIADALINGRDYGEVIREYGLRYPDASYGGFFRKWLVSGGDAYNSFGNGSAMRVSPVGWAFNTEEDILREAERSAAVTHNHPEGIKGAQTVAFAIFLARKGSEKDDIKNEITKRFGYFLDQSLDEIRPGYKIDETCQGSVPQSIRAFLESVDVEDTIRKAVSLGGDADTLAATAGSIAEAYYAGVPEEIASEVRARLPDELWYVIERFNQIF